MKTNQLNYVAYYRVSTQQQGRSGLGLEAQQYTVEQYCKNGLILQSFTDIESGKHNQRPELMKAIELCKQTNSILIIAKLDRLSRNSVFIGQLMESKINFKCCDMPEADSFTIHIFAALAQREREMISNRTKQALKALKDRGIKLGSPNNVNGEHCELMRSKRKPKEYDSKLMLTIKKCKGNTLQSIADELNKAGYTTTKNKQFTQVQIHRLLKRIT